MFKHILVPLDGSRLAESALQPAEFIASRFGSTVTLIHVIEKKAPQEIHGEHHLTDADEACKYLEEMAKKAFPPDIRVERHVHTTEVDNVARSIVDHAGEFTPDLIVMCTHGSGGLHEWLVGSIAQQVLGMGKTPVLLIRPPEEGQTQPPFHLAKILVPLDGKPVHEQGLSVAEEIATCCRADLHLLVVVPNRGNLGGQEAAAGRLLPGTMTALLDLSKQEAETFLAEKTRKMANPQFTVSTEVSRGDPAQTIVDVARQVNADLIVVGTHGKAGANAFWSGSVAPKLPGLTSLPLLFVPVAHSQ